MATGRWWHLGVFDTRGTFRAKRFPAAPAQRFVRDGWSFIDSIQWWDTADGLFADRPAHHAPVTLDESSMRPFPFEPDAVTVVGDFDGALAELSPRTQLARSIDRLSATGLTARLAWEFETIVLTQPAEELAATGFASPVGAAPYNRCWSPMTPAAEASFFAEWTAMLEAGGIPVDHVCSELGPGCYELALGADTPLASADQAAFAKVWTRAFCQQRGLTASFMAQLDNDFPGLGGHPILSLHDGETNVTAEGPLLGVAARQAVGGILTCLPDLMALVAPTVNSYRRYAPGNWAPRTATWGYGNYTCAVRAVCDHPDSARLEFRLPGADTAPHLCAAMLIGAAAYGIENAIEPPEPTSETARTIVPDEIGPLPRTLLEAAERLASSGLARKLLGDAFVEHYAAALVAEDEVFRRHVSAFERARYLHHV